MYWPRQMINVLHVSDAGQPWYVGRVTYLLRLLPSLCSQLSIAILAENSNIEHGGLETLFMGYAKIIERQSENPAGLVPKLFIKGRVDSSWHKCLPC